MINGRLSPVMMIAAPVLMFLMFLYDIPVIGLLRQLCDACGEDGSFWSMMPSLSRLKGMADGLDLVGVVRNTFSDAANIPRLAIEIGIARLVYVSATMLLFKRN